MPSSIRPLAVVLGAAGILASNSGCTLLDRSSKVPQTAAAQPETSSRYFPPPFALAKAEDAIVRVLAPNMTCTGTVIEDDLVLTAHHCVVERDPHGAFTSATLVPASLRVELGGDDLAWGEVGVRSVVVPPCGEAGGGGDVAVLVLTRKLVGLGTMPARLDGPPRPGDVVDPVGFGRCATSGGALRRVQREGGTLHAVKSETMELDASVCPGDSGAPLVLRGTHEVVGVVSLSAMDGDERTRQASIGARVDVYRSVFAHARMIADGLVPAELPPLACH